MVQIATLETQAEEARVKGKRDVFLKLKEKISNVKEQEVQNSHNAYFKRISAEFPVGKEIPELHTSVKELKHGCGTHRGWIEIYLYNHEKALSPHDLRKKIQDAKNKKVANEYFEKLKFSDRAKSLCIGDANYDTLDMLIKVMSLDLPDSEEADKSIMDNPSEIYDYKLKEAKNDGYSDEKAEEMAQAAEDEERSEEFEKYLQSILRTINYLLNFHDLELVSLNSRYWIIAQKSWKETANKVAATITGYGMFEYNSGTELRDVGPYKNYCQAVITHLHWFKHYPSVYGNTNYTEIYSREWR